MKRILLIATSIIVASSIFVFCGCEVSVDTTGTTNAGTTIAGTSAQEPTAIVEVTNEQGTVIATEAVTMSANDKEQEKDFFRPSKSDEMSSGVSSDRVQQALQNAGINTTNPSSNSSSTTAAPGSAAPFVQDDYLVLRSSQYMINMRVVDADGVMHNFKIAKNGKNSSVTAIFENIPMTIIMGETTWYLLTSEDKSYIEIPKNLLEQEIDSEEISPFLFGDPFKFGGEKISETTEVEDGITYTVFEFDSGNKEYYIGKTLIKTVSTDSSVTYFDSISAVAPLSLFSPPADYTKLVITEDNASDIMGTLDPSSAVSTTHNHDHDHDHE